MFCPAKRQFTGRFATFGSFVRSNSISPEKPSSRITLSTQTPYRRDTTREKMIKIVGEVHEEHPTHVYHRTAAYIQINMQIAISDNYAYKCCRYLGIKAETKHRVRYKSRKVRDLYPKPIFATWETVDRPRQVIVSEMTAFKFRYYYFEVTFYFDVFTKEILAAKVDDKRAPRTLATKICKIHIFIFTLLSVRNTLNFHQI